MTIKPNDHFRHYKRGTEYRVLCLGTLEATETPCVVYQSLADEHIWIRPVANFIEEVELEGRLVPRFSRISEGE